MIDNIDDYFAKGCDRCAKFDTDACATQIWADGLAALRTLCRDNGLTEVVKWGHPCYMHGDRNIAIFGAFTKNFRLSFMNGSLLKDPDRVLEKLGPHTETATVMTFRSADDVAAKAAIITRYLCELKSYADAGIKPPPKHHGDLILPDEFMIAVETDTQLAQAFKALTPGRQRGWNLHFTNAKQSKTRENRIAKARDRIIAGKGWNER